MHENRAPNECLTAGGTGKSRPTFQIEESRRVDFVNIPESHAALSVLEHIAVAGRIRVDQSDTGRQYCVLANQTLKQFIKRFSRVGRLPPFRPTVMPWWKTL